MKKIVALLLSLVFMMSAFSVASAEEISNVSYYVEYNEDGTATVIFQAGNLYAFDFGIIYESDKLTVTEYDFSEEFYDLAMDDEYTSIYVKNDKAVDNVGNSTYVVFTGAIMYTEDGESVGFGERDLAKVTFSGIDAGEEIAVVIGTAQVEDVKNAQFIGAVDLYEQVELSETYLLDGAIAEPEKTTNDASGDGSMTWLYGVVLGIIVIAVVVVLLVSKKNKLDVNVKEILEEDDEDNEDEEDEE